MDGIYFYNTEKKISPEKNLNPVWIKYFMLFLYFVFILVLFGIVNNWGNPKLLLFNVQVFFFKNLMFDINVFAIFLNEWGRQRSVTKGKNGFYNPFTGNLMILHISIILAGLLYFFVVRRFPDIFVPENLWGSVIIIAPFLVLKALLEWRKGNNLKPGVSFKDSGISV
ncbi:MAG: hypothetical protein ABIT96_03640 [Ferruginibacter sp.]